MLTESSYTVPNPETICSPRVNVVDKHSGGGTTIRTFKRKLKLNKAQQQRIDSWIGACRTVYNLGLEISIAAHRNGHPRPSAYDLQKQITGLRKDIEWIKDAPCVSLQDSMERLNLAYQKFFKDRKGFPKFASKKHYRSITLKRGILIEGGNKIAIPKIGVVGIVKDSPIIGVVKRATVVREVKGYFICVMCEVPNKPIHNSDESQVVGIDMGIAKFLVSSNGEFIVNPSHFKKYERRLRIENRTLARRKNGSNRWKKQAHKLSVLHNTIGNVRREFLHNTSTQIARKYHTVYLEKLNVAGMAKNKNLSKHILDCGWGMFRTMLQYKTNVVLVNPAYTSQTCPACDHVSKENRKSQESFCCIECGYSANADFVGATNILRFGIKRGDARPSSANVNQLDCAFGEKYLKGNCRVRPCSRK